MPITTIDPTTALIVVDLQRAIVERPLPGMSDVVAHAADLAHSFRERGLPVVLVNVDGGAPGRSDNTAGQPARLVFPPEALELAPELDAQDSDHRVTKRTFGAFTGTGLDDWLRERDVTQVVVCGVSTSIGVESTARFAHELGYHVTLATDAMLDSVPESHAHSVERIFPRLGETGTTAEIIASLPR